MATTNRTAVTPDLRTSYPHMAAVDAPVWEAWLTAHRAEILEVYYDVALGGVEIDDPNVDQAMRDGWRYATACKIDAVAVLAEETLVCEVKPTAHMGAIGQALGYTLLLRYEPINALPMTPTIITTRASAEVTRVAEAYGVRIDIVFLNGR